MPAQANPATPQQAIDSATVALACELLARPSITPDDRGCQRLIGVRLERLGFDLEWIEEGGVTNLWATRGEGVTLAFAGHTDVVPTGPESAWATPPFSPTIDEQGYLRARGAADMKGSLAAMVTAIERFVTDRPDHQGRIAVLLTSDEEGPARHGTRAVVERLRERGERIDYCVVGEPSSSERLGDVVKNGRRGSLNARLRVIGVQGHVAYPQRARNPIHLIASALARLTTEHWDEGNEFFPATTFQVSNFDSGTGATNVIPGEALLTFNFRFSTESTSQSLIERVETILADAGLETQRDFQLEWNLSGEPFLTAEGALLEAVIQAVESATGQRPRLSTSGGTSDGRFIATLGAQVVELGPLNDTIHQVDERVLASDLDRLSVAYQGILAQLLAPHHDTEPRR
ncbi:succinyl-diaminopimelate desuccinylase [Halotalea alkalilenta]|uniref:succinyl-diaminopimelate desuccinylase n=1 Tax=Halotalea alkalilenta TaxID=376489 RepID=UPI000693200A|nr:succinyl-diaminopimelate desuccinylase [Halotalea alkalilenta]